MYTDSVVLAGLGTVLLMLGFFGGLYLVIRNDIKKHPGVKRRR